MRRLNDCTTTTTSRDAAGNAACPTNLGRRKRQRRQSQSGVLLWSTLAGVTGASEVPLLPAHSAQLSSGGLPDVKPFGPLGISKSVAILRAKTVLSGHDPSGTTGCRADVSEGAAGHKRVWPPLSSANHRFPKPVRGLDTAQVWGSGTRLLCTAWAHVHPPSYSTDMLAPSTVHRLLMSEEADQPVSSLEPIRRSRAIAAGLTMGPWGAAVSRAGSKLQTASFLRQPYTQSSKDALRGGHQGHLRSVATPVAPSLDPSVAADGGLDTATSISIIKPEVDKRDYRYVKLENGLEVMLVSDPHTERAAASMSIRAGHMQDPWELPGMAHFHEHLLFLGTEKYPEEGEYEKYLSEHGGASNAWTAMEETNYYFDVSKGHLEGALDRFSQFFLTPLFDPGSVDREIKAIDSEHSNNLQDDAFRQSQVLKSLCDPRHPFAKFGSGNLQTLSPRPEEGVDTREALLRFHHTYYSANVMKLAVLGQEDVDTLEAWTRQRFSRVRNTAAPEVYDYGLEAFGSDRLGKWVKIVPVKEQRKLTLLWPLPPRRSRLEGRPQLYISHLLGHEGQGSLHAALHERGWARRLSAGAQVETDDFQLFRVSLTLTEEGMGHVDEIISLVYQYLALMRQSPPMKHVQDELNALGEIAFRYREKGDPTAAVQMLSGQLQEYPPQDVLHGAYVVPEWRPEEITDFLQRLTPRNCMIQLITRDLEKEASQASSGWQREKWYGTPYKVEPIAPEQMAAWEAPQSIDPALKVFGPNEFIPTDFTLRCDDPGAEVAVDQGQLATVPQWVLDDMSEETKQRVLPPIVAKEHEGVRVWHKMDASFRVPKSIMVAKLLTPLPASSPELTMHSRIFSRLLKEDLTMYMYDASLADLHFTLDMTPSGMSLGVSGYSQKLPMLLEKLLAHIRELMQEYKEAGQQASQGGRPKGRAGTLLDRFENQRQLSLRAIRNSETDSPYEFCSYYTRQLLDVKGHHLEEYRAALESPAFNPLAMVAAMEQTLTKLQVDVLAYGNVDQQEASQLAQKLKHSLAFPEVLPADDVPKFSQIKLPLGQLVIEREHPSPKEENSAVEVYFQADAAGGDYKSEVAINVIDQLAQASSYKRLRTEEQLGYTVWAYQRRGPPPGRAIGWSVVVQSSLHPPHYLDERIEAWIASFREELAGLSDEEFDNTVSALVLDCLRRDSNLAEEAERHWGPISDRSNDFFRRYHRAEAFKALRKEEVLAYFDRFFAPGAPERAKLSTRVYSQKHPKAAPSDTDGGAAALVTTLKSIEEIREFKGRQPVFEGRSEV